MMWIGPESSLFDFLTFAFMYFVICPAFVSGGVLFNSLSSIYSGSMLNAVETQYIGLFQAGWFIKSIWSQTMAIHMIRTAKLPFLQSRASAPVTMQTILGSIIVTIIPYTPVGKAMGFTAPSTLYFAYLVPCILLTCSS